MDFTYITPHKLREVGNMPETTILRTTFHVGRKYKCTMTFDCSATGLPGAVGYLRAEWDPSLPKRRLNKAELRDYHAGRNALLAMAASAIGGRVAIAEV